MSHPAPCATDAHLFESTLIDDHRRARNYCTRCPIIDACRDAAMRAADRYRSPEGTWAGQLWVEGKVVTGVAAS